jgi:carbamate kinase
MIKLSKTPSKPIGGFMSEEEAKRRQSEMGWNVVEDAGRGWRRVVASPIPQKVVELDAVETLINNGTIVITVGGGGIPVIENEKGEYVGVAAVIDKDYASSLLARLIKADLLLISTAVEKVALNYGKPDQRWIDKMTLAEAKQYLAEGTHFAKGSMAPKIQAIIWFLEAGGKQAIITNPENIGTASQKVKPALGLFHRPA